MRIDKVDFYSPNSGVGFVAFSIAGDGAQSLLVFKGAQRSRRSPGEGLSLRRTSENAWDGMSESHGTLGLAAHEDDGRKRRKAGSRGQYVARACTACHRRKMRCDGLRPCNGCHRRSLRCHYDVPQSEEESPDADRSTNALRRQDLSQGANTSILTLEKQMQYLTRRVDALQSPLGNVLSARGSGEEGAASTLSPTEGKRRPRTDSTSTSLAVFPGPTSSNFSISVATNVLSPPGTMTSTDRPSGHLLGLMNAGEGDDSDIDVPVHDPDFKKERRREHHKNLRGKGTKSQYQAGQTVDIVGRRAGEALRLLQLYESVIGVLHPILDLQMLEEQVKILYSGSNVYDEIDISILNMTLAIALLAEEGGSSEKAMALYHQGTRHTVESILLNPAVTLKGQLLLTAVSMFYFFCDDQRMASRIIAAAARLSLEAGLYRREVLFASFPEQKRRLHALKVLWSIFVLDRQFSFATGLPQCLRERDVDLPELQEAPYLKAMASYVKLGERAWRSITDDRGMVVAEPAKDNIEYFQYELQQWQKSLPTDLQPHQLRRSPAITEIDGDAANGYLTTLLYLRANQLKLLILRPLLFSLSSVASHKEHVVQAVEVAKDTILVLVSLQSSNYMYRNRQPIFNHFLTSALAVLFLAYGQQKRNEMPLGATKDGLNKGLDLARSLCEVSRSSRRLLRSFSRLKELISRLGGDNGSASEHGTEHMNHPASQGTSDVLQTEDLLLEQEFNFSFLFDNAQDLSPEVDHTTNFAPQVAGGLYKGLQDYAWMFQDF